MKRIIKYRFVYFIFIIALVAAGFLEYKHLTFDPLKGWKKDFSPPSHSDKIIEKDYQDYIQKLPEDQRKFVGPVDFFEDGTGQHAVRIEVALYGTVWYHTLFYDKDNKRIKVIKYAGWHYMS